MLFIFDTNTLISAILNPTGIPMQALVLAQQHGKIIFPKETKEEMLRVGAREKFDKYLTHSLRVERIKTLLANAEVKEITFFDGIECRDPNDIQFLRLALSAKVDYLISGDIHLKELNPFRTIPIINSANFIQWISSKKEIDV